MEQAFLARTMIPLLIVPGILAFAHSAMSQEPFDYFRNSWNVIGLKDYERGTRITPDNQLLLAGKQRVSIWYGRSATPLSRQQTKTLLEGWLPVIQVSAEEGSVRYCFSFLATPLPSVKDWIRAFDGPSEGENFLTWATVRVTNTGSEQAAARVKIKRWFSKDDYARIPEPSAEDKSRIREIGPSLYDLSWTLQAGQSAEGSVNFPFFPVEEEDQFQNEEAKIWLERTAGYWKGLMSGAARIRVPCQKASEALLAAHVCQLLAIDHGEVHGGEGFYDAFYIRDGAYQVMELEEAGLMDIARRALDSFLNHQRPDGRFESQQGQFDANGQAVLALWQFYKMTGDKNFLAAVYPQMRRAVDWTIQARREAARNSLFAGLLPAAPADGEYLWEGKNHIVGYDFWNLRGMLCTADAARALGKKAESEGLLKEVGNYRRAIDAAAKRTGLGYFPPSWEKEGTHWGNTETLWPTRICSPDDRRVAALSHHVRKEYKGGYVEGIIRWFAPKSEPAIHPYMGAYTTMDDLNRGQHEQVAEDFYWYLLHSTAAHAFPEGVYYEKRTAWGETIPHVTGAANYALMLRHMLVHEAEGELHLLSAIPDWWLADGQEILLERAPTHFGELNLKVRGRSRGVEVEFNPPSRQRPTLIVLHLPRSRPLLGLLPGVKIVTRPDQKKRWDFPTVVTLYNEKGIPLFEPQPK